MRIESVECQFGRLNAPCSAGLDSFPCCIQSSESITLPCNLPIDGVQSHGAVLIALEVWRSRYASHTLLAHATTRSSSPASSGPCLPVTKKLSEGTSGLLPRCCKFRAMTPAAEPVIM